MEYSLYLPSFCSMHGNYDAVAGFYDPLARLVFGNAIREAQTFLLPEIPKEARILIAGGGTGWILEEITRLNPGALHITYVEISEKMIGMAKKRYTASNEVIFINGAIQEVNLEGQFDVVLTPFLFDNFSETTIKKAFRKMNYHLKAGGLWLFSDFKTEGQSLAHQILLKVMYLFFSSLCKLETTTLHDPSTIFLQQGYTPTLQKTFFSNFIYSVVYQKHKSTPTLL